MVVTVNVDDCADASLITIVAGLKVAVASFEKPEALNEIVPLNPPKTSVPPDRVAAAKDASVDAFHLAALVSVGLLVAGAAANGLGLRGEAAVDRADATEQKRTDRAVEQPGP